MIRIIFHSMSKNSSVMGKCERCKEPTRNGEMNGGWIEAEKKYEIHMQRVVAIEQQVQEARSLQISYSVYECMQFDGFLCVLHRPTIADCAYASVRCAFRFSSYYCRNSLFFFLLDVFRLEMANVRLWRHFLYTHTQTKKMQPQFLFIIMNWIFFRYEMFFPLSFSLSLFKKWEWREKTGAWFADTFT